MGFMMFIFYLFFLLTIEMIIKKVKEFFKSETQMNKINEIINKSNIKSVNQNYIFKIVEKKENIITSIIVIVVFILLVTFCGDTSDGPPRFFGDVR